MKKTNQALSLSLLLMLSGSVSALEVPDGQGIYSFDTKHDSMAGIAKASAYTSATDITYLPINVFAHVVFEDHYWVGETTTVAKGLSEPLSHIAIFQMNQYDEYVMETCYNEPIPVNATVLVYSLDGYQQRPVDIPSYRSDRMCMHVPYYEMYTSGSSFYKTEYVVIIE